MFNFELSYLYLYLNIDFYFFISRKKNEMLKILNCVIIVRLLIF